MTRIRPYQPGDHDAAYRVCLQTADSGQDATSLFSDPELPGHVWLGPYVEFEPELAFVAEDAAGVGGYVVAALDTGAFEERLERGWWPPLRQRYPEPPPGEMAGLPEITRNALLSMHHPWITPVRLTARYPAHLHIDLVPRLQGGGHGRRLITTLTGALRAAGSPGVHLMVGRNNKRAVGFYRHLGFAEYPGAQLSPDFPAASLRILTMKLR